MYGCMPISPEMVDDAESLIPVCPLRAASAQENKGVTSGPKAGLGKSTPTYLASSSTLSSVLVLHTAVWQDCEHARHNGIHTDTKSRYRDTLWGSAFMSHQGSMLKLEQCVGCAMRRQSSNVWRFAACKQAQDYGWQDHADSLACRPLGPP